jgi:hypothetical protein
MSDTGSSDPSGSSGPSSSDLEARIEASIQDKLSRSKGAGSSIADRAAGREDQDRSNIAGTVMTVFLVAMPLSLLFLFILSFRENANKEAITTIADILKSVLMPIMTLVLGYYFGRGRT